MTRLPGLRTRVTGPVLAGLVMLGLASTALAQTGAPEPEIDSAPKRIRYGRTAVIRGHLNNGAPGDEVTLQRHRGDNTWWNVSTKPVDADGRVVFKRHDMKRTTFYRLVWSDEVQGLETSSGSVKVRVKPRLTLNVNPDDVFIGRSAVAKGRLLPKVSGRHVYLKKRVDGRWKSIGSSRVRDGRFSISFDANHKGRRRVKIVFSGDSTNVRARRVRGFTVYRRDQATWYGPGFYGNRTACGKRLTDEILGVAHRTLPCGAQVSILYQGRTITVPVIDRGPYTSANWDLTQETAERLGFSGRNSIGVTR